MSETSWWEKRWFLALMVLATMVPLLLPETPPLVDLPGHMGRYHVQRMTGHNYSCYIRKRSDCHKILREQLLSSGDELRGGFLINRRNNQLLGN